MKSFPKEKISDILKCLNGPGNAIGIAGALKSIEDLFENRIIIRDGPGRREYDRTWGCLCDRNNPYHAVAHTGIRVILDRRKSNRV